jgi:hypothetical protein
MTSREHSATCPRCGQSAPFLTSTTPVVHCSGQLQIAESSECRRCGHGISYRIARMEKCVPGSLPGRTNCP